jgi:two-component system chemotaxis sensor kinase CheA
MLFAAFQVEHRQHLGGIRAILDKMEQGDIAVTRPDLDELFRCAHSLKAAARACDFHFIETISHRLEMLFSQIRKSGSPPRQEVFGAIRDALTAIEDWTLSLTEKRTPPEPPAVVEALDRVLGNVPRANPSPVVDELGAKLLAAFQIEHKEHLEAIRSFLAEIEQGGFPAPAKVDEAFRRAHSLKGAARLAELPSTEELADRLENVFSRVREGTLSLNREGIRAIGLGLDAVEDDAAALVNKRPPPDTTGARKAIDQILEKSPGRETAAAENASVPERTDPSVPSTTTTETVRVSAENLDRLLRSTGQLLSESLRQKMVARELNELDREIDGLEREWARTIGGITPALQQMATTPELSRVSRSLSAVEKQIRSLRRRGRAVRRLQQSSSWNLTLLGGQIQQDVRRVRTVSAETVFQGFRKMMRDLARDEGKEIDFRINGLEIEADRMVLQALKDPLMHVLRNAVSHGLEPPDERRRLGKESVGHVTLHLEIVGSRLIIRVEEDGRGIDFAKVAAVAVSRSFLTEAEAATASQAELASLLFAAGFSTARQVTGLSGRGMGLSVVSEAAARLQGEVELRPRPESGTIFILSVPLTISTQRLLLVSCHAQTFAIPLHSIERLLRIKLQEIELVEGRPTLIL